MNVSSPFEDGGKRSQEIPWGECIYDHYTKYLGEPAYGEDLEQSADTPLIQVLAFDNVFGGCRAFCSFGFSRYHEFVGEVAELFMPVDDGWDETPTILAGTLFYILQRRMRIGWGISIDFSRVHPEFVVKYGKTAVYISNPFGVPEGFDVVRCGMEVCHIYLGCYITASEHRFFVDNGAEEFENLLTSREVDVFHVARPSVI